VARWFRWSLSVADPFVSAAGVSRKLELEETEAIRYFSVYFVVT
jgi:hypothetical protein